MQVMRRAAYSAGMMIRETGQALDRLGCRLQGKYAFREQRKHNSTSLPKAIIFLSVFIQ